MVQDRGTRGGTFFMAKWIATEKARAGLRHAVVRPNVTEMTKEMIAQSKRARAGSLAIVDLSTSGANLYPPGVFCVLFAYYIIIIIIIFINVTLARSLESVVTECKEHTIHTQTQIVASRKPKEIKHTHEGEANFTT